MAKHLRNLKFFLVPYQYHRYSYQSQTRKLSSTSLRQRSRNPLNRRSIENPKSLLFLRTTVVFLDDTIKFSPKCLFLHPCDAEQPQNPPWWPTENPYPFCEKHQRSQTLSRPCSFDRFETLKIEEHQSCTSSHFHSGECYNSWRKSEARWNAGRYHQNSDSPWGLHRHQWWTAVHHHLKCDCH